MTKHYHPNSKLELQKNYIGGHYLDNQSGDTFSTIHPGNGEHICDVETAGQIEVDAAVAASKDAFESWSELPAVERGNILRKAGQILRSRNQELAELETLDTGKPISETCAVDILSGADVMEYYAGVAQTLHGQHFNLPPNSFAMLRREPIGVCAGIGAWNYPIQIALWKSGPALACGNTMVFKPAEQTPLTTLKLAEIYSEAGVPDGVFNVIQGARDTGSALISHKDVSKVTLTGSVETGKAVMAHSARDLKKVTLELGGKSPVVVFEDANLNNAVNGILAANFYSSGQICSNGTRVFVHKDVYEEVLERLKNRTTKIKVGNPFDERTDMGPLVSKQHFEKVQSYIDAAMHSGARHICGGEVLELDGGFYVTPAIFSDCTEGMSFVDEEVFGPLMAVMPFSHEDEVLDLANNTSFGLAGAVFTQNFNRAHRVANKLQAGMVWINEYNVTPPEVPFGGYKQSGVGRENGLQTIEHYTQIKTIYANLGDLPDAF